MTHTPGAAFLTLMTLLLASMVFATAGCGPAAPTANAPNYLRVFDVAKTKDDAHPTRLTLPAGDAWFATGAPLFTLSDVEWTGAALEDGTADKTFNVRVTTRPAARRALTDLRAAAPSTMLGIVLNDQLVHVAPIGNGPDDTLLIALPFPPMLARRVLTVIQNGGPSAR